MKKFEFIKLASGVTVVNSTPHPITFMELDGTLVTDPARNQGFPLGSEVTFNNGALLGNTITEGFTRNLYIPKWI